MKATYNTAKEIAELYINSGLKDKTEVRILINESAKQLARKVGMEKAKEICTPFMANSQLLFTVDGLTSYLEAVGIDQVNFACPFTGKIEHTAYIILKSDNNLKTK